MSFLFSVLLKGRLLHTGLPLGALFSSVPAGLRCEQDEAHLGLILVAEKLLVAFPRKEKEKKKKRH